MGQTLPTPCEPSSSCNPQGWALSLPALHSQRGQVIFPWAGRGALDLESPGLGVLALSFPVWTQLQAPAVLQKREKAGLRRGRRSSPGGQRTEAQRQGSQSDQIPNSHHCLDPQQIFFAFQHKAATAFLFVVSFKFLKIKV